MIYEVMCFDIGGLLVTPIMLSSFCKMRRGDYARRVGHPSLHQCYYSIIVCFISRLLSSVSCGTSLFLTLIACGTYCSLSRLAVAACWLFSAACHLVLSLRL